MPPGRARRGHMAYRSHTFRALSKTYGQMWLRCDVCRRYARLNLAGLHDVDYRSKTFSCSRCGADVGRGGELPGRKIDLRR
jgi:hypothetical protein